MDEAIIVRTFSISTQAVEAGRIFQFVIPTTTPSGYQSLGVLDINSGSEYLSISEARLLSSGDVAICGRNSANGTAGASTAAVKMLFAKV